MPLLQAQGLSTVLASSKSGLQTALTPGESKQCLKLGKNFDDCSEFTVLLKIGCNYLWFKRLISFQSKTSEMCDFFVLLFYADKITFRKC